MTKDWKNKAKETEKKEDSKEKKEPEKKKSKKKKTSKAKDKLQSWKDNIGKSENKFVREVQEATLEIQKLAYDGNPGIILCVYGLPGKGKSIFAASASFVGKAVMIDLTKQGRNLEPYAKQFPDLDYVKIFKTDGKGSFSAGRTYEHFVGYLKKVADMKDEDGEFVYKVIIVDGYSWVIKHVNMYLRQVLGLSPISEKTSSEGGEISYFDWSWRTQRYLEMQNILQNVADQKRYVILTAEGHYKTVSQRNNKGKIEIVKSNEIEPILKPDKSDQFLVDIMARIYVDPEKKRHLKIEKSKVSGIKDGTEMINPSFEKLLAKRKEGQTLKF